MTWMVLPTSQIARPQPRHRRQPSPLPRLPVCRKQQRCPCDMPSIAECAHFRDTSSPGCKGPGALQLQLVQLGAPKPARQQCVTAAEGLKGTVGSVQPLKKSFRLTQVPATFSDDPFHEGVPSCPTQSMSRLTGYLCHFAAVQQHFVASSCAEA